MPLTKEPGCNVTLGRYARCQSVQAADAHSGKDEGSHRKFLGFSDHCNLLDDGCCRFLMVDALAARAKTPGSHSSVYIIDKSMFWQNLSSRNDSHSKCACIGRQEKQIGNHAPADTERIGRRAVAALSSHRPTVVHNTPQPQAHGNACASALTTSVLKRVQEYGKSMYSA